jgi:hypothetical protein
MYNQGYFCDGMRQTAVPELFFRIGITNTTPVWLNFGSLFAFWNLFQKKHSAVYDWPKVMISVPSPTERVIIRWIIAIIVPSDILYSRL